MIQQKTRTTIAEAIKRCTLAPKSAWVIEQVKETMLNEGATDEEIQEMLERTPVLPERADV